MNIVFQPYLPSFIIMFIDDILVYPHSKEEHEQHLRTVLQVLREKKLYAKLSECKFWMDLVALLVHMVSSEWIKVDLEKIEAVQSWPRPSTVMEIRSFLGLAGYYCRFVEGFSSIAGQLTMLTPFRWSKECEEIFQKLKTSLTTALVLVLPSGSRSYTVYYDLSRKAESMGSLAFNIVGERHLDMDVQELANRLVSLDISELSIVLACVVFLSSLFESIKAR
ncbi:putative mitochondrial protein AtMg00860 [Nicotiana tabacum]|uniref:Mitochondrial protein AtMg00860 n=1 Tax=Nicotiana tabacum TaxID=4097 RepID=A0AC58SIZ2_TOBAC